MDDENQLNNYEFTLEQNLSIKKVRATLLHNSILMFAIGFLLMLMGHRLPVIPGWVTMLGASFFLILGLSYFHPLVNFKRVITTSDDDVNQMVTAIDNLQTAFAMGVYILMIVSGLILVEILTLLF